MRNLLELLDTAAGRRPDAPAFCDETCSLTWARVKAGVDAVGTALAAHRVQHRPVALYLDRSAACPVAMLGVLAAGGFYTVLDTSQPAERIGRILQRLQPAVILADKANLDAARALNVAPVLEYEQAAATAPDPALLAALRAQAIDTDLAYVLFTSGSTGEPKGVAITHRNVLAYSEWAVRTFGFTQDTVFGGQTPFYFSMSVTDLFSTLRAAARLEILPRRLFSFPVPLLEYLTARGVNTLYWVPTALGIVSSWKALDYTALPPLTTILFAGEVMPTPCMNYWRQHYPRATFANLYGPTETTDICAFYRVDRPFADNEPLPIGRPCENCGILLLKDGRAAAPGEEGELCARGSFVAAGYYAMPDKTAERFVQNPLQPNYPETIYRTGDLARLGPDGLLHYCGRMDSQIKHLGYRIEPGEVETAAQSLPGVEAAVCLYDADRTRLVLFYQSRRKLDEPLRQHLAEALPAYMRPAVLCRLRSIPTNANGKLDRTALKAQLAQLK